MYGWENEVHSQLVRLRDEFGVRWIKAEFEAEGSSFRDVARLRRLTGQAGLGLLLKIGGCEGVRDLRDALELGADALVAPMIESPFALSKFWDAVVQVYGTGPRPRLAFNLETRTGSDNLEAILDYGNDKLDGLTIGRTDLAGSYLDPWITPDSSFLLAEVEQIVLRAQARAWEVWMGGSLSHKSVDLLRGHPVLAQTITHFETRKVVLPAESLFEGPEALDAALRFEELWLLSRQQIVGGALAVDSRRLEVLQTRR